MNRQRNLFNHQALASSRKVNAARRARDLDSTFTPTEPNTAGAQFVPAPAFSPEPSRLRLPVKLSELFSQDEIRFNDEMRFYELDSGSLKCPECGYAFARLEIKPIRGVPMYRVVCRRSTTCSNSTDWFGKSQDAIRVWKLAAKLAEV